jgi:small subunit ribosomal protein S6
MYILDVALDEAARQSAIETLENTVRTNGGEVVATREFGRRRLAFEIEGHHEGVYMILYFTGFANAVEEVKHEMRLIDGLVRGMVVVANPKCLFDPTAPAAVETTPEEMEEVIEDLAAAAEDEPETVEAPAEPVADEAEAAPEPEAVEEVAEPAADEA